MNDLDRIARDAVSGDGIVSAAIFVGEPGASDLALAAAAGIDGAARDGLVAAVRNPNHPIRRAMTDDGPTFDVTPMNPGGPALRSHLPLADRRPGRPATVGVLAVAHDAPLSDAARRRLETLADSASASIIQGPLAKERS